MEDIKLVEYNNSYAKSIADMWRRSTEGWNGNNGTETEESILKEHESITDINTYLALKGEEVVGYCGFSKYQYDDNTLYIRLLNVRYDLHGMGIGRALVCKCVERTTELGWPRVDLFTWPGNTKSLPLYKRCGFFLEKRDDTTHLMNFIPKVLNTEVFKEYFKNVNWYRDLKRTIDMEPDGIEEDGFTYYEYSWEKEGKELKVQFENKSRGIRLVDAEDYLIKAYVEEQKLIFGEKYKIKYEVLNKSKTPLNIKIKGLDDKNIKYSFNDEFEVLDREIIEGEFVVEEPKEKVASLNTYPSVISEVLINGKSVKFRIGIDSQYPADISLKVPTGECYKNVNSSLYLDIKNNYQKDVTFEIKLRDNESIKFIDKEINISMKANEKKSLKLQYILNNFNFYNELIEVRAKFPDGKEVVFTKALVAPFKGREERFGGKTEEFYMIANGPYSLKLDEENSISIEAFGIYDLDFELYYPMLGRPFSEEFSNGRPNNIEYYEEGDKIVLKITYISEIFKNIRVESILKLSQNGIVEYHYEIYNDGDVEIDSDIFLCNNLFMKLTNGILPIKNKFVQIIDPRAMWTENFNLDDLTENWIYARGTGENIGICWHKDLKIKSNGWKIAFEHNLGKMKACEKKVTKPVFMVLNTFKDWKDFRNFALEESNAENLHLNNNFEVIINEGNPFVEEEFAVSVKQYQNYGLDGEYSIISRHNNFEKYSKSINTEDKIFETKLEASLKNDIDRDILKLEVDSKSMCSEEYKMVFKIKDVFCESKIIEEQGHKVHSVNNGVMEIKACETFSHVLYSLKCNNHDFLESSFPKPMPKSWFNPWFGGIGTLPEDLSFRSVLEENIKADFVTIEDNLENKWQGIKVKLHIENHEKFKGLIINQYYLMLPGVPVLCHTAEIVQNTGKFMSLEPFESFTFFNFDGNLKNNWLKLKNINGGFDKYKVGVEAMDIPTTSSILYGSNGLKDKIQLYLNHDAAKCLGFINMHDTTALISRHITMEEGIAKFTSPDFYIFTEDYIEDELLKDLKNIRF